MKKTDYTKLSIKFSKKTQKPRKIEYGENHVSQRKIEVELVNIVIVEYHYWLLIIRKRQVY